MDQAKAPNPMKEDARATNHREELPERIVILTDPESLCHDTSTNSLQLVKFDQSVDLPECTLLIDRDAEATQVYYLYLPEVVRAIEAPIIVEDSSLQFNEKVGQNITQESKLKSSNVRNTRRNKLMILTIIAVCLLAIGLGIGFGTRKNYESASSTAMSLPSPRAILNNTSLAAFITDKGDKYLFFQDNSKNIRQAFYDQLSGTWNAPISRGYIVANNTRSDSPIAAYMTAQFLAVFYIQDNNTIGVSTSVLSHPGWSSVGNQLGQVLNTLQVAPDSNFLSVTGISLNGNVADGEGLVFLFERGEAGNVSLLYCPEHDQYSAANGTAGTESFAKGGVPWVDLTDSLYSSLTTKPTGPFSLGVDYIDTQSQLLTQSGTAVSNKTLINLFLASSEGDELETAVMFSNGTVSNDSRTPGYIPSLPGSKSNKISGIPTSDFVVPWTWAINTQYPTHAGVCWVDLENSMLVVQAGTGPSLTGIYSSPSSRFPYTRLAVTTAANATSFYLYHQMNDTVILEELWNGDASTWVSPSAVVIGT